MPKGLTKKAKARLIETVNREIIPRYETQAAAADAVGINPATLNRLLGPGAVGGSMETVELVAAFLNRTPAEVMYGSSDTAPPTLADVSGFAEAFARAKERAREEKQDISDSQFDAVGRIRMSPQPSTISAALIVQLAITASRTAPRARKK